MEELSSYEFSRGVKSLGAKESRERGEKESERWSQYLEDAYTDANYPVAGYGDDALGYDYLEEYYRDTIDDGYSHFSSFRDFEQSTASDDAYESGYEMLREDVNNLTREWSHRINDDSKDHILIEGSGMGWRGLSGYNIVDKETFMDDPISHIAPKTDDFNQTWIQDKDGETLRVTQSHHDAMGESYIIRAMDEDELGKYLFEKE